ncbi:hypothetical protein [Leifsonia sp. Leaf264]|uniref:hypothetical protein n=1 Tax=Leifsonia sp. Leaf264 TaxID=1736314 RepID=UPI0007014C0A|nr:hypothetical protein [Leifsonia sp. Leaf264]KQO98285.1 hypothetical protein ASF30_09505 [Leifsonia sp. Leaf264]
MTKNILPNPVTGETITGNWEVRARAILATFDQVEATRTAEVAEMEELNDYDNEQESFETHEDAMTDLVGVLADLLREQLPVAPSTVPAPADPESGLTPSQQDAVDGEGGMFIPVVEDGYVTYRTAEGDAVPINIWAGWSSTTPGLPLIGIDTGETLEKDHGPRLRIAVNDGDVYNQER